jgi:hypothetical protein
MFTYRALQNFRTKTIFEKYFFEVINIFILISISALLTQEEIIKQNNNQFLIITVGILVIYSYLTGRLQPKRLRIQINNFKYTNEVYNPYYESLLIITGIVYFSFCINHPYLAENTLSLWFYKSAKSIYHTPVLGHIAAFFGFLFMIYIIFQSIIITLQVINVIIHKLTGNPNPFDDNNKQDDDFDDFELLDEETKNKP